MNELNQGTEIPLSFATEKGNDFTISASEFRNFDSDIKVILKDKQTNAEFELTSGQPYAFSSDVVNNTNRFSLIFKASGSTTEIDKTEKPNVQVFVNAANQITIIAPEKSNYSIYNTTGQIVNEGIITSNYQTTNYKHAAGVYVVRVSENGSSYSTRIVLNCK